jgi:3-hydroxyisobutyrate dehydrogenase
MRVGFVGLGTMGGPMARNLLRAGFDLCVHNRTRSKEETLAALGASRAPTPGEASVDADVVVTMLPDSPDVEAVTLGPDGIADRAPGGCLVIDMSTIAPDAAREIGARLRERGIGFVDAPVSGGSEGAEQGALTIMAGGAASDVERARPLFEVLGSRVTHVGPLGAGQATKAVNQVIVGGFYMALAEGIVLGMRSGLDMDAALQAISAGACRSWVLENRSSNMLNDDYPLGFKTSLHLKDLGIALRMAAAAGAELPLSELVASVERKLVADGLGDRDVSAIAHELRRRAGM